jgi:hypothetical protein
MATRAILYYFTLLVLQFLTLLGSIHSTYYLMIAEMDVNLQVTVI